MKEMRGLDRPPLKRTYFTVALGSIQPPIQRVLGAVSPGVQQNVKMTTHLKLAQRSTEREPIHPLPQMSSWLNAYLSTGTT
jgi:hypothetical protein